VKLARRFDILKKAEMAGCIIAFFLDVLHFRGLAQKDRPGRTKGGAFSFPAGEKGVSRCRMSYRWEPKVS
jgi:hypothetical protein